jgi:DNA polymerase/3'-5' exonuclease PolX
MLDYGGALTTLRLVPPDREQNIAVRNPGMKPLTLVLEHGGMCHTEEPGERVETRKERDVFELLGLEYVEPQDWVDERSLRLHHN